MVDSYKQDSTGSSLFRSRGQPDMGLVNLPNSSQSVELPKRSSQRAMDASDDDFEEIGNPVFTMYAADDEKELEIHCNSKVSKEGSPNDVPTLYWNELSPAWLNDTIAQNRTSRQDIKESSSADHWASPIAVIRPLEQVQVIDNAIVVVDRDGDSESELTTVAAETGENMVVAWKPSQHIHNYLGMMNMFCTARIHSQEENSDKHNLKWVIVDKVQTGIYCLVVSCSLLDSLFRAKYCFLSFLNGERFYRFVNLALYVINFLSGLHATYLLRQKQIILDMLTAIYVYEERNRYDKRIPYLASICAASSVMMAIALPIFYFGVWDESPVEVIQYNSYDLGHKIFLWDWKNMNDTNQKIYEELTEETTKNIVLGMVNMLQEFFAFLLKGQIWDLMLVVIVAFFLLRQEFILNDVISLTENASDLNSEEALRLQAAREVTWRKWRMFRSVEKSINNVFGSLLPFFRTRNVLMYSFFMCICIIPEEDTSGILYFFHVYNLVKSEVTYVIASKIAQRNESIRRLLRNWGIYTGKIVVGGQEYDLQAILDELDREPVVFGRGVFAIDERFHFGMLGFVLSLFVSLANGIGSVNPGP